MDEESITTEILEYVNMKDITNMKDIEISECWDENLNQKLARL